GRGTNPREPRSGTEGATPRCLQRFVELNGVINPSLHQNPQGPNYISNTFGKNKNVTNTVETVQSSPEACAYTIAVVRGRSRKPKNEAKKKLNGNATSTAS